MNGRGSPLEREVMLERRAVLRRLGWGAAGLGAATFAGNLMAACASEASGSAESDSGGPSTVAVSSAAGAAGMALALDPITGSPASSVKAFDPSSPFWDQGAFRAIGTEVESTVLEVEGAIPPELTGLYVRNGSNPTSGVSPHWFLGDGMLHGVRIEKGKAIWYRNRWVQTPLQQAGEDFSGIPGRELNQSNVAVIHHGGRLLTTGEVGWPYEIDTKDLSTVGPQDFGGEIGDFMTAHPKIDPATGKMHFFGYGFTEPYLSYYVADANGFIRLHQSVDVGKSSMIHDFAITDRDAVFWEGPVLFGVDGGVPGLPYGWQEDYGFRFGVMPLDGPTSDIRWIELDPQFIFHGTNAHREGSDVVLTANRMDTAFVKGRDAVVSAPSMTHRWRIDTSGPELKASVEQISDIEMDLPTHDRRYTGRKSRHGWYVMTEHHPKWGFEFSGICHLDLNGGADDRWEPGELERPGEAFFVPASESAPEGEGWLLTYAYDRTTDLSHLAILDAQNVAQGPVARVRLPARVPFGFHGYWVADA